jgi:RNA polymerase sigma-70 factor (ECF subfamily)
LTDAELIQRSQAGDRAALQALYERYLPAVWRYAYARSRGNVHLAEDVVSEAFLALVRSIGKLQPDSGPLGGWLIKVAANRLIDQHRRGRLMGPMAPTDSQALADSAEPAEVLERREYVARALERLPDEERMVLEWKYVESLAVREIAGRLGRTEKAVESVLYRARRAFKSECERLGGGDVCRTA